MPAHNDSTFISPETRVSGSLSGDVDVTVAGHLDGEVNLTATLTVAEQGRVDGAVVTDELVVHGTLTGTAKARRVHLTATARVTADVDAGALRVDDGAVLTGAIEMDLEADAPAAPARSTAAPSRTTTRPAPSRPAPTKPAPPRPAPSRPAPATQTTTTTTTTVVEEEPEPEPEPQLEEPTEVSAAPEPDASPDQELLDELDNLTVKELREALRELDLQVSGSKSELVERLAEARSE